MIVGVEAAVLYQNISFWVETNRANKKNFFKGKYWTYNSARAYSELFPFWDASKIVRLLIKLEAKDLIESGVFNKQGYDRTKWYTTSVEKPICQNRQMDSSKTVNGLSENGKAIPDINTNIKPDTLVGKAKSTEKKYTKDDIRLTDSLYFTISKSFPNHKVFFERKAKDADYLELNKLNRIDGYSYEQIEKVLKWLYTSYSPDGNFDWKKQILSTNKLRKHFFRLTEQMEQAKKSGQYRPQTYSSTPPSERKKVHMPAEVEKKVSPEEAEKNRLILDLVRAKKVSFSDMKTLKSKSIDELQAILNPV